MTLVLNYPDIEPPNRNCCSGDVLCEKCSQLVLNQPQPANAPSNVPNLFHTDDEAYGRSLNDGMHRYSLEDFNDYGEPVEPPQIPVTANAVGFRPMPRYSLV